MFEVFWFYLFFKKGRCFSLFFIGKLFGMAIEELKKAISFQKMLSRKTTNINLNLIKRYYR